MINGKTSSTVKQQEYFYILFYTFKLLCSSFSNIKFQKSLLNFYSNYKYRSLAKILTCNRIPLHRLLNTSF